MDKTGEMYAKLFNSITDAYKKFQEGMAILERAQIEAEEIYISEKATDK